MKDTTNFIKEVMEVMEDMGHDIKDQEVRDECVQAQIEGKTAELKYLKALGRISDFTIYRI